MKFCKVCLLAGTFLFALTENCRPSPMVPWLTRSADKLQKQLESTRDSTDAGIRLSPRGIIRATIIPVIGPARVSTHSRSFCRK
jgi:hypothetical protein